ncbi:hypothetical protein [Microlunatus sp. GCM10028923]|uniref:endo-beta-N-acetylglucosaminidase n=1 Tax=Microlunatus sp. GCM10028923 TaxID=3273400 RepID=UPI00361C526E
MSDQPRSMSRKTFLTVGGAGLAALLVPHGHPASAAAEPGRADFPKPGSGGIPPGPSTYGWNAADVLAFDPAAVPWAEHLRCTIPRAERIAPFAPTQAHPDLDPEVQLSTLTMDDTGSIYEARNQPIGLESQTYTQRYWAYIDIWGTWHGQVLKTVSDKIITTPGAPGRDYGVIDIPNPGWTEAAHKNGARAIGGWFWPRSSMKFDEFLVQREDGSFPIADKLIEIKRYFGFDGLFINQEASITAKQVGKLKGLFAYLKSVDPDFYLQWYDAVLPDSGYLNYQDQLNENNLPWLGSPDERLMDSIFINYAWPYVDRDLSKSAAAAKKAGFDPRRVGFAGVEHQQGGFNPGECFGDYAAPGKPGPLSVALFVDTSIWSAGFAQGKIFTIEGRATFRDYEQKFWSGPTGNPTTSGRLEPRKPPYRRDILNYRRWDGIAHSIVERSPYGELPIVTTFNIGVGSGFWLDGERVRETGWDNMGCADRALTWQYWIDGDLSVRLDETIAYEGGHSLAVDGAGVLHLFKTDLRQDRATKIEIRAQGLRNVELGLTWSDRPDRIDWRRLRRTGSGWEGWVGNLPRTEGSIARVSLRVDGTGQLGRVALVPAGSPGDRPGLVTGFTVQDEGAAPDGRRHLSFRWQARSDAWAYDVLQTGERVTWLGRVHRDVFFAEAVDLAAGKSFALVPIFVDGGRGEESSTRLAEAGPPPRG